VAEWKDETTLNCPTYLAHAFRTGTEQECALTVTFDTFAKPSADGRNLRIAVVQSIVYARQESPAAALTCGYQAFDFDHELARRNARLTVSGAASMTAK
jgi:hypothetical protein